MDVAEEERSVNCIMIKRRGKTTTRTRTTIIIVIIVIVMMIKEKTKRGDCFYLNHTQGGRREHSSRNF
jgi:hypothetical protein